MTLIHVLPACANLLALDQGKQIDGFVLKRKYQSNDVGP
jgi:hypothetical protein